MAKRITKATGKKAATGNRAGKRTIALQARVARKVAAKPIRKAARAKTRRKTAAVCAAA